MVEDNVRILLLKKYKCNKSSELDISLILYNEPKDSMVIATPFFNDKCKFYYNRKSLVSELPVMSDIKRKTMVSHL